MIVPVTLKEARRWVNRVHRHHKAPQGGLFAVGWAVDEVIRAVAIVGRPVARHLDDGWTCEVTRVASDGAANACSALYAACWRAVRAMGYRRLVTYTLRHEPGTTLRAAGWKCVGEAGGGNWNKPGRPRMDSEHPELKLRWEAA